MRECIPGEESDEHSLGVGPVEPLPCDWKCTTHPLELCVSERVLKIFDGALVSSLSFVNGRCDAFALSRLERNVFEVFLQIELDVACFVIMCVDFDRAAHRLVSSVD